MNTMIPIASGSSGNCMYISIAETHILIDMGATYQWVSTALRNNGLSFENIDAILITHAHPEHVQGLIADSDRIINTIYVSTQAKSKMNLANIVELPLFQKVSISPTVSILAFPTSHDSVGSIGFVIAADDYQIGYVTDLGVLPDNTIDILTGVDTLIIEANHDKGTLANGRYPEVLRQRIISDKGHLSNVTYAEAVRMLADRGTSHFILTHLSQENNTPELAYDTVSSAIQADSVKIDVLPVGMGKPIELMRNKEKHAIAEKAQADTNIGSAAPPSQKEGYDRERNRESQKQYVIYKKVTNKREAEYAEIPETMLPQIKDYLANNSIRKLYSHQEEMFNSALEGKNIVITTSTASGKTLAFLLPVLQDIVKNPLTRAIFIYPTKALASDQYRAMLPLIDFFGKSKISIGVYDGDTPVNERSRIRNSANIILTNPEMINSAFLPHHNAYGFNFIFSNLKYVVIDELHSYRGAFGSHLANVFRRLNRVCRYYSSSPQFLCSSATIANPVELAENICGKEFYHIGKDGSPAPQKQYYIVQPPQVRGTDYRVPVSSVSAALVPELVMEKRNFIDFCKSRKAVEVVLKESRDKLRYDGVAGQDYSDLVSGYRGGYTPQERKEIENKMVAGKLQGLISTNALELGIDIGKVDTTVLTGYPGTRASFWQQSGRAGRSGKSCDTFLILDNSPFDQYLSIEPDWLFEKSSENAVIDKNNLFIQLAHIRAAAVEWPLTLDDIALFPDLGEIIPVLIRAKELRSEGGKFIWCGKDFPTGDFSLRNMDKVRYKLTDSETFTIITEMDETQAFREIYEGAVYMHDGQSYQVLSLDLQSKTAIAKLTDENFYTDTFRITKLTEIKEQRVCPNRRGIW